jgi:hypothetical protein
VWGVWGVFRFARLVTALWLWLLLGFFVEGYYKP